MKCHICNSDLKIYAKSTEYTYKCPNDRFLSENHLIVVYLNNIIVGYSAIINYNNIQYMLYSNSDNTGIQYYDVIANGRFAQQDIATFSYFSPIIIINDFPDFIPLTKRLLSLKAFS